MATIFVDDYGAVGNGATNDHAAIQAAVTALNALGHGALAFRPDGNYLIYVGTQSGNLCSFANLSGVNVLGNGARLTVDLTRSITASLGTCFAFDNCSNIFVDGFVTDGPVLDVSQTTVKGVEFVRCVNGCRNIRLGVNRVVNWLAGFITSKAESDPDTMRSQNIVIDLLDVENCWYGINGQYSSYNRIWWMS